MILPVYIYGHPVLKKRAAGIDEDFEGLAELLKSMWDTMYNAKGVGLAAPQIGRNIRIFVVDTKILEEEHSGHHGVKKVFINAQKVEETGDIWEYEEGCLSIPDIRGDVERPERIRLRYFDQFFDEHDDVFEGLNARVIQHEYDHIEGVLFTEKLKPIKRRRIKRSLDKMRKGLITVDYPVKFARR